MTTSDKYNILKKDAYNNYWAERILTEIGFLVKVTKVNKQVDATVVNAEIDKLFVSFVDNGAITKDSAMACESALMGYSPIIKKYRIIASAHAHIDMNWMWGFQETTAVTVDTFRTMLNLMKEYPEFTFSQSQASTYKIIEEYAPEMIDEIKEKIHSGNWELTASTWVETDKNMPNGESLSRHILYTKKYLSKLFDVTEQSMEIDFEPDTFGHNINVPEILNNGGVKYYYHCRGYDKNNVYTWKSPSGASILVYREPEWYNASIKYDMFLNMPEFCDKYGIDIMLKVYGVGDHGGGPTRRDIEIIRDMSTWPLQPTIKFGTFHEFYHELEAFQDTLPIEENELNYVFTGCYTSQSRIKMANRFGEDKLYESEALSTWANVACDNAKDYSKSFGKAWENILFNHFHDIIPGSGIIDTREYAMGIFQKSLAYANTNATSAINALAMAIDTSSITTDDDNFTISEGAGVGFNLSTSEGYNIGNKTNYYFPQTERGRGKIRIFTMFNTTAYARNSVTEITVWDMTADIDRLSIKDSNGKEVLFKVTDTGTHYWGHTFVKVAILTDIASFGYATYVIAEKDACDIKTDVNEDPRCDYITDNDIVLENNNITATFEVRTMKLISLVNKKNNAQLVSQPSCLFRYIKEDDAEGMTAWRVGKYMDIIDLNEENEVRILSVDNTGIRKTIRYIIKFKNSSVDVTITLDENANMLKFSTIADWHEVGKSGLGVPQLAFYAPFAYCAKQYKYDIPFGTIIRKDLRQDVPANSFACSVPCDTKNNPIMVVTDSKYGFRGCDNSISVNLIRSSYDPDKYPEYGIHNIEIGVGVCENIDNNTLFKMSHEFVHPINFVSNTSHSGKLPLSASGMTPSKNIAISALKTPEVAQKGQMIIRGYNVTDSNITATMDFAVNVKDAKFIDINENIIDGNISIVGKTVKFDVKANGMFTIKVLIG